MPKRFRGSAQYWQDRYVRGGHSGMGSRGVDAGFKAGVLNTFVAAHAIQTVVEFGCGDGQQLAIANYPRYLGIDVSAKAVALCRDRFNDATKRFVTLDEYDGELAELALSLDVIYHLVEDDVFADHVWQLFNAATRYVIIYSSNAEGRGSMPHMRHRQFTPWVASNCPGWTPAAETLGIAGSLAQFFFYSRDSSNA